MADDGTKTQTRKGIMSGDHSSDLLEQVLASLDRAAIATQVEQSAAAFDPARGGSRKIVIFGTRFLGRLIAEAALKAGLELVAWADNDPGVQGSELLGAPVLSPAEAVARFDAEAAVVVGAFHSQALRRQLADLGCRRIVRYAEFFWNFAEHLPAMTGMTRPDTLLDQVDDIRRGFALLADETSRREFAGQIAWRCTLDDAALPQHRAACDTYFDPELIRLGEDESVIDCGAFDGDTLRIFLARCDGRFRRFYALEPDPDNRAALNGYLSALPADMPARITVLPHAVGDHDGTVRFSSGCGPASRLGVETDFAVSCRRLDGVIDGPVSFIKMDVEGAELSALAGAATLLIRHRPIVAVTAYHHSEHLWQLPQLLRRLAPDHRLFLRRYAEECWETVYYAIPPERLGG